MYRFLAANILEGGSKHTQKNNIKHFTPKTKIPHLFIYFSCRDVHLLSNIVELDGLCCTKRPKNTSENFKGDVSFQKILKMIHRLCWEQFHVQTIIFLPNLCIDSWMWIHCNQPRGDFEFSQKIQKIASATQWDCYTSRDVNKAETTVQLTLLI